MSKKAIQEKSLIVDQIIEKIKKSSSLVLIDYQGLTVFQDTKLRNQFRASGVEYKVLKNRLVQRALEQLGYKGFNKDLEGPTSIAFGTTDMAAPAKILNEAVKEYKKLRVKCGLVDGSYLSANDVTALAALPSKAVLISKLLGAMQSPITGLASVLNNVVASLPRVLQQIAEKKA